MKHLHKNEICSQNFFITTFKLFSNSSTFNSEQCTEAKDCGCDGTHHTNKEANDSRKNFILFSLLVLLLSQCIGTQSTSFNAVLRNPWSITFPFCEPDGTISGSPNSQCVLTVSDERDRKWCGGRRCQWSDKQHGRGKRCLCAHILLAKSGAKLISSAVRAW